MTANGARPQHGGHADTDNPELSLSFSVVSVSLWFACRCRCLLLPLLLTACAGGGALPAPPTLASVATLVPTAPAATPTPGPSPTAALPPTPTHTPTPSATPTPALPALQVFTDPARLVRVRVPRDWTVSQGSDPASLQLSFASPDGASALFIYVSPLAGPPDVALERFVAGFLGPEVAAARETLPDGTLRLSGTRPTGSGTGRFEAQLQVRGGLLGAAIAAADEATWAANERLFEELFATFHLFPANAAALLPEAMPLPQTVDPASLETGSTAHFSGASGTLWVIGEVANRGSVDAESVTVAVQLLSGDGRVVAEQQGNAALELLLAGESAPFVVLFQQPPPATEWVTLVARAGAQPAGFFLEQSHLGLVVAQAASAEPPTADAYQLEGTVRNEGDAPARAARVVAALYDAEGRLIATTSAYLEGETLAPGAEAPFDLTFFDFAVPVAQVADFRVWVAGQR